MTEPKKYSPAIEASLAHFRSIPWVNDVHLSDNAFQIVDGNLSRAITQPGNGHSLTGETWNTEKTIAHLITMYRPAAPDREAGQNCGGGELRRIYTFGTGLNAHPNLLHGGVIATILDSAMGNVIHQALRPRGATFTVLLNITYKKPVSTPGTVLVRSSVVQVEGRKIWARGAVEGGDGEVHATAEGMWLMAKANL
ncbi:uncharacterized protein A1O9_09551 [Exophiala aquamarina CBS 119918]|uniref:Thioesterase domain-containing protein n=1 Tax=Exophiala aquamarina CBS 119918 TaxID=1182545 RepID=A0A072PFR8_9EURO|nr:uncharacterized protein A1O9_09551 [Exophiala aquamarina CBS 119918]KEF54385.1 hypothetical protein A1O9_09551 [Exophiala aquamarina CBS 119918]